jgi:type IV secretory pathway TraG/TraD family ATPase VirD4
MGLIATQSVAMLQNSSLKDAWRGIFSNFSANIFMRLNDNETAKEASELAGEHDFYVTSEGRSVGKDGQSLSSNTELRERKAVPGPVFTQVLRMGDAVVTGRLDGGRSQGFPRFLHVP